MDQFSNTFHGDLLQSELKSVTEAEDALHPLCSCVPPLCLYKCAGHHYSAHVCVYSEYRPEVMLISHNVFGQVLFLVMPEHIVWFYISVCEWGFEFTCFVAMFLALVKFESSRKIYCFSLISLVEKSPFLGSNY